MNNAASRHDRAARALGVGVLITAGYVLLPLPKPLEFVDDANYLAAIVLAVSGILAEIGGVWHRKEWILLAGAILATATLAQLVGIVNSAWLIFNSDASLMTVFGAFGLGLLLVGLTRPHTDPRTAS